MTAHYFYKFYARCQIAKMVETYYEDMRNNQTDFVFETPAQIKQRLKAMEYYNRCLRIRQAKERGDGSEVTQATTVPFHKIEAAVVKL